MATKQQILDDFITAFKAKDEVKKRTLAFVKSEILVFEKSGSDKKVDDDKLMEILKSMAKKRKESIAAYEAGNRDDLAKIEQEELAVIEAYLPEQMSEGQVRETIEKIVADNGFVAKDFGQAMGKVMSELRGKVDGGLAGKILKEILT